MEIETFFHYKSVPGRTENKKLFQFVSVCFADCICVSAEMS